MSFVNELIPENEKNNYDFDYIMHPSRSWKFNPRQWCIDRERGAFFIRVPGVGRPEPEDPENYALVINGQAVRLRMHQRSERTSHLIMHWYLDGIFYPENLMNSQEEILGILRDALSEYRSHGLSIYGQPADSSIEVHCEF